VSGATVGEARQPTMRELIDFVYDEARLLDAKRFEEWNRLFTDDGYYWIPLVPDQPDALNHTSHMYEDKLLRDLRIERFKSPRAYAQHPPSRCHHLLQQPRVESADVAGNLYVVRTEFHYSEARGDDQLMLVGTMFHHLLVDVEDKLKMKLKRVNLLNCDAALPAVQLFI
jgi:3-phenylpropionate/cinnamic acid dioxygenase small subunit